MANNLPDLDTQDVGFVAFYNPIKQTAIESIDPSDVTSQSNIDSNTLYDNGVEGLMNTSFTHDEYPVQIGFRVKNDGWIVAYTQEEESYATQTSTRDNVKGDFDVIGGWVNGSQSGPDYDEDFTSPTFQDNTLYQAIELLFSELTNSGSGTFSKNDIGLYNSSVPSADTTTMVASFSSQGAGDSFNRTYRFLYSSDTSIEYAVGLGTTADGNDGTFSAVNEIEFVGRDTVTLTSTGNNEAAIEFGAVDLIGDNLIPDDGTEYGHDLLNGQQAANSTMTLISFS